MQTSGGSSVQGSRGSSSEKQRARNSVGEAAEKSRKKGISQAAGSISCREKYQQTLVFLRRGITGARSCDVAFF